MAKFNTRDGKICIQDISGAKIGDVVPVEKVGELDEFDRYELGEYLGRDDNGQYFKPGKKC